MTRRVSHRHPPTARLPAGRRLLVNGVALGLWASGAVWLMFHYFLNAQGEFGPTPSPLEPWWLKLHGAFAFAALWTFGLIWGAHVVNGWSLGKRRASGVALLGAILALILTGYLLYYAGSDEIRAVVSSMHWVLGLGAPALYLAHRVAARLTRSA